MEPGKEGSIHDHSCCFPPGGHLNWESAAQRWTLVRNGSVVWWLRVKGLQIPCLGEGSIPLFTHCMMLGEVFKLPTPPHL